MRACAGQGGARADGGGQSAGARWPDRAMPRLGVPRRSQPISARNCRRRRRAYGFWAESRSSAKSVSVEKSQSLRRVRSVWPVVSALENAANRASSRSLREAGIRACMIARAQGRGASALLGAVLKFGITPNNARYNTGGQGNFQVYVKFLVRRNISIAAAIREQAGRSGHPKPQ